MSGLTTRELELCMRMRSLCACSQLRRAAREITHHYDAALEAGGLAVTQLPILVALGSEGDLPISILADALALDRTTLTRNLRILEVRGLVRMVEHEHDARVRLASLTAEGTRVLGESLRRWEKVQGSLEAEFGAPRLQHLSRELAALREAVEELSATTPRGARV